MEVGECRERRHRTQSNAGEQMKGYVGRELLPALAASDELLLAVGALAAGAD